MFYLIGMHFALRGGQAHRDLTTMNFQVSEEQSHPSYLQYTEKVGKTMHGGIKDVKHKHHSARAYTNVNNSERCPVMLYSKYISLCPQDALTKSLYLQTLKKPKSNQWYSKAPVGHNALSGYIKSMMDEAAIKGNFTNHSLRVTTVTRLFDHGQDIKVIKNQTGHRSDALLSYRRIDGDKLEEVSNILNNNVKRPKLDTNVNVNVKRPKLDTTGNRVENDIENHELMQNLPSGTHQVNFHIHGGNNHFHM